MQTQDPKMLKATYELLATTALAWGFAAEPDKNGSLRLSRPRAVADEAEAERLCWQARSLWREAIRDRPPACSDCVDEIARVMFMLRRNLHAPQQQAGP